MKSRDKRENGRVLVSFPVTQFIGTKPVKATAVDLGFGGMRIEAENSPLVEGEHCQVMFELPWFAGQLICAAQVRHRDRNVHGLAFTDLGYVDRQALERYVSTRLAGTWFTD